MHTLYPQKQKLENSIVQKENSIQYKLGIIQQNKIVEKGYNNEKKSIGI